MTPFPPTPEQSAILSFVASSRDNLIVSALAGAAKTSTLVRIAEALAGTSMLFLAFNKRIQVEMKERLPSTCEVKTLNGLGHGVWKDYLGKHLKLNDDKIYQLLRDYIDRAQDLDLQAALRENLNTLKKAVQFGKTCGWIPNAHDKAQSSLRLMDDDEFFAHCEDEFEDYERAAIITVSLRSIELGFKGEIDFADQLLLPTVFRASFPVFRVIGVDEAQDLSALNHLMLRRLIKAPDKQRIIAVGDRCQCQPAGTKIFTSKGIVKIEDLQVGDTVLSLHRDDKKIRDKRVLQTAKREYSGPLIDVIAVDRMYSATPNHRCMARLREDRREWHGVYLMQKGGLFRIGKAALMYDSGNFGIAMRARQEKADNAWLLRAFRTKEEALAYETVVSGIYGIPDLCFLNSGETAITQDRLDHCWSQIAMGISDFQDRAIACLENHGMLLEYPIWRKGGKEQISTRRQCLIRACNLLDNLFEVPIVVGDDVEWIAAVIRENHYEGFVYSLEVESSESTNHNGLYIANGIVTGNSIYGFRGAHEESMDLLAQDFNMTEFPLTVCFRCPQSVIEEARSRAPAMQWAPTAELGTVSKLSPWSAHDLPTSATVICRNNAPLFHTAIRLLKAGRYPELIGNDIAAGLVKVMEKLGKPEISQEAAMIALASWQEKTEAKTKNKASVRDRADCVRIFLRQGETLGGGITAAKKVFSSTGPIKLMTVHKAKGLEFNDVYFLDDDLIDLKQQQERNLRYVAQTRAKKTLTYIYSAEYLEGEEA